jgi:hypothetical protein
VSRQGQGSRVTESERAEVKRLAAAGVSVRGIAREVFGDVRLRGRVERILARPASSGEAASDVAFEPVDLTGMDWTDVMRLFLNRRVAMWAKSGRVPSVTELRGVLDLERQLEAREMLERLNRRGGRS